MKKNIALLLIGALVFVAGCDETIDVDCDVGAHGIVEFESLFEFYDVPLDSFITTAVFEIAEHQRLTESTELSMLSDIEKLVIHISDDTPIYFENGVSVRGTLIDGQMLADILDGRILQVWSTMMLSSFPGQTFPHFIKVLESYAHLKNGYIIVEMISGNIIVNGEQLGRNIPAPFWARGSEQTADGGHATIAVAAMVPLQPLAEALGLSLLPVDQDMPQRFNVDGANGQIGNAEVRIGYEVFELPAEPWIDDDGEIFVPTEFFSEILNYNVFVWRGA